MTRSALVTGASSGIGEATARHLAGLGFRVFAGVRKDEDAARLREADGDLRPLKLDVTDQASIDSARGELEQGLDGGGLQGLVNNAGVSVVGPLEYLPIDEWRKQLEVNVIGQVAVTQAFMELLRTASGRIVNVSSIGGRMALPLMGPYNASKFAIEAISDSLRRELRGSGVQVAVVEPGAIRTAIWDKGGASADALMEQMPPEALERYGELMRALRAEAERLGNEGLEPIEVARVVEHALTADKPRTRYLVGMDAKVRARLAKVVPDKAFDALIARTLSD